MNKNDAGKIYISMQNGDFVNGDYHIMKIDGSIYSPDFSTMDDLPDHYVGFKDDKLYVPYLGYGDHPYLNWCFDLNGDTAGTGNSEEIAFDDVYEKGYWNDDLKRALIEISNVYDGLYGVDIWN